MYASVNKKLALNRVLFLILLAFREQNTIKHRNAGKLIYWYNPPLVETFKGINFREKGKFSFFCFLNLNLSLNLYFASDLQSTISRVLPLLNF